MVSDCKFGLSVYTLTHSSIAIFSRTECMNLDDRARSFDLARVYTCAANRVEQFRTITYRIPFTAKQTVLGNDLIAI